MAATKFIYLWVIQFRCYGGVWGDVCIYPKDEACNVEGVGVVCDECYFDLCECRDNAE